MGRTPRIPPELKQQPFSIDEARDAGLTRHCLRGKSWRRISSGMYRWSELPDDPWLTLAAWGRVLPRETVFTGGSAAWLLGLDLEATNPVEVVVPPRCGIRTRTGLLVHHGETAPADVVSVRGLRATALPLTLTAIAQRRSAVDALVAIDMALHGGLTDRAALSRYVASAKGRPGVAKLRALASVAAPAESPMETRLRWLLTEAGLPRPDVQTTLRDSADRFVGRADIYYSSARLVVEYDGSHHRERLVEDNRRQNLLVNARYHVLRFTAADIRSRPHLVVAQVREALGASR